MPGVKTRPGAYLAGSFGAPLMDFFVRFGNIANPVPASTYFDAKLYMDTVKG